MNHKEKKKKKDHTRQSSIKKWHDPLILWGGGVPTFVFGPTKLCERLRYVQLLYNATNVIGGIYLEYGYQF